MISSLPYATLEWRLGRILGDGSDDDLNPDYEDLQGQSVRIVPSIQGPLIYINGSGKKITVFLSPVDGVIGPNGELHAVGDVNRKVRVLATDDANLSATGWTWSATVSNPSVVAKFAAPAGTTVDISEYLLAPPTGATQEWVSRIPELLALLTGQTVSIEQVENIIAQWMDDHPVLTSVSWGEVQNKPAVIASGETSAAARQAINAKADSWTPQETDIPTLSLEKIQNLTSILRDKADNSSLDRRLRFDQAQTLTGPQQTQGQTNLGIVDSTTSTKGLVQLATTAETQDGTDTARAVTPAGLAAAALTKRPGASGRFGGVYATEGDIPTGSLGPGDVGTWFVVMGS